MANESSSLLQIQQQIKELVDKNNSNQQKIRTLEHDNMLMLKQLEDYRVRYAELQQKYESALVAAATTRFAGNDVAKAKARITAIIKEIEICIAQLSQ
ncbi:MAG: hypothetical protein J6Y77_04035 [Paludibacteraceae bacterium]|nr:hypothetical protein [Paludibacteraceae bacterium]